MQDVVTQEELLAVLNRELDRHRECSGARFTAPRLLPRGSESSSCNWSREDIYLSTSGSVSTRCWSRARQILREAELRYRLQE